MSISKKLPENAAEMSGGTNGSLGDATRTDLQRGFTAVQETHRHVRPMPVSDNAGFLGRANGWER